MLPALPNPELFFGLCSPIGVDNKKVRDLIENCLKKYDYSSQYFKVTDLMKPIKLTGLELKETPIEEKYDSYIKYANKIREVTGYNFALAALCCLAVRKCRRDIQLSKSQTPDPEAYLSNTAYIFDQFKRKEEVDVLRQVYGQLFVAVSVYSEKDARKQQLIGRIGSDHADARPSDEYSKAADDLMKRDQFEEGAKHGQRLEEAFPVADLFLNIDDTDGSERLVNRFLDGLFGSNSVSPTKDEYGMYAAHGAALRSVDLSRQVGAAVFSQASEILSLGCNEVPKAGGGTYWTEDKFDARDVRKGYDSNERIKKAFLADFARRLSKAGFLKDETKGKDIAYLILKQTEKGGSLRDAHLMDLLEFGRMIHAEMSAISDAARVGKALKDGILYCTTFPCHMCAKHIVASGIKRVVYIEPFPKSYAEDLHGDAIVVGKSTDPIKVCFEPFIGIAPFRYRNIFSRGRRKNSKGDFVPWADNEPRPIVKYTVASYILNERAITTMLTEVLDAKKAEGKLDVAS